MAQDGTTAGGSSYTIDNVTFPVGRTKLQSIFDAIRSTNIGNTAPDLVAGQFWIDNNTPSTTVWTLYFYDGTDNISFATIDTINNTVNFLDSTFDLVNDTTPQLGGTLDANGNNIDMGTNLITDTKVGQWDTAYSWGDHSTQGYLTSETDSQTLSFSNPNLSISNGNSVDLSALNTGILNVSEDTTPQLGGDLDLNSSDVTGTGNVNITGTITSTGDITTSGVLNSIAPTRHSIRPSLNLDFANSKELDPRITFTRASNATYYDGYTTAKAEENLVTYSNSFDSWGKSISSITENNTTSPSGAADAALFECTDSTGYYCGLYSNTISVQANQRYILHCYVKNNNTDYIALGFNKTTYDNVGKVFDISTGTLSGFYTQNGSNFTFNDASITSVGGGWYKLQVEFTPLSSFTGTANIGLTTGTGIGPSVFGYTQSNIGEGFYLWNMQLEQRDTVTAYTPTTTQPITNYVPLLQTAGNNVARFDHNPVTGESLGLLIEESRTNLLLRSEEFDNAYWVKTNATVTANAIIAPNGTLTAEKLIPDTVASGHHIDKILTGAAHTLSIYAKAGEYSVMTLFFTNHNSYVSFNLLTGTIVETAGTATGRIESVGNGWYRCSVSTTSTTHIQVRVYAINGANFAVNSNVGDGYSGIYIWGAQLEVGAFPTSYIPTVASQVTRSDDRPLMENIDTSEWFKQGKGTLYSELSHMDTDITGTNLHFLNLINSNSGDFLGMRFSSDEKIQFLNFNNGSYNVVINSSSSSTLANTYHKASFSFTKDDAKTSLNGTTIGTDTSFNISQFDQLSFNWSNQQFNGHMKKASYYPINLTQNEINDLTEE